MSLGDLPLSEVLSSVGAPVPAPGGGSAAALSCALAAALVEMAAGIEERRGGDPALVARAGELKARALALAEEELEAYAPVIAARRRGDAEGVEAALVEASRSPVAVAEAAAAVAEAGAAVAAGCDPSVRGDALAGVLLAEAAAATALALVGVNADGAGAGGAELLARARAAHERAAASRAAVSGPS
jgi:formiminotetrahydrofolate cyclodeaminase